MTQKSTSHAVEAADLSPDFGMVSERHQAAADAPIGSHLLRDDSHVVSRAYWHQVLTPSDPTSALNEVVRSHFEADMAMLEVDKVEDTYRAFGVAFKWCVWPWTHPRTLDAVLTARGYRVWGARAMVIDTDATVTRPDDVEVLVVDDELAVAAASVHADVWGVSADSAAAHVTNALASPRHTLFLARIDGEPVGLSGLFEHSRSGYLMASGVRESWRGRGVYRSLVAERLAHLAVKGMPLATAHAREATSAPALAALGFETEVWYKVFETG